MSGWDEGAGRVSRAFNDWFLVDGDQRAFLKLGLIFAAEAYGRIWDEASREPGDPDGPELIDVFEDRVDGLHQHDYEWMHLSGVLRDAVTGFEVYLEKAREEILWRRGEPIKIPERSPWWRELENFYKGIGVDVNANGVKRVRDLRHFLAHRRGELRTQGQRAKFAPEAEGLGPINAELSESQVSADMGVLGAAVRRVDAVVYSHL